MTLWQRQLIAAVLDNFTLCYLCVTTTGSCCSLHSTTSLTLFPVAALAAFTLSRNFYALIFYNASRSIAVYFPLIGPSPFYRPSSISGGVCLAAGYLAVTIVWACEPMFGGIVRVKTSLLPCVCHSSGISGYLCKALYSLLFPFILLLSVLANKIRDIVTKKNLDVRIKKVLLHFFLVSFAPD